MRQLKFRPVRKELRTVDMLLQDIEQVRREANAALGGDFPWYFRGDTVGSDLKPHIGRRQHFAGKNDLLLEAEEKLLNRFKRFAYQEFNREATDWEALFLARHYGLPTRIMDWSYSPLVALYFSCSPRHDGVAQGVLWGIRQHSDIKDPIDVFDRDVSPLKRYDNKPAVKLVYPVYNSSRMIAQKGLFTWHSQPSVALDIQADQQFEDHQLDISWLVKWPIVFDDNDTRVEMLQRLERLGFSSRTIIPDLEGIAAGIWQTELLFRP